MPKMNVNKSIFIDATPAKIFPIINETLDQSQWEYRQNQSIRY
jgi:hypothetical protein